MVGTLQPLVRQYPIANTDGTPTEYFIRWAQERQIDITEGISAEQALAIIEQFTADHPLIAGTGITLTPDGDIAHDVTIAANIQALLNTITTTRGSVLYRGASNWSALAPGTSGQVLQTNGAGADPTWATPSGGGGGYEGFGNLLSLTALTPLAGASANLTLSNGTKANSYSWTASGANTVQMAYGAAPSTPWDIYLRYINTTPFGNNVQFGIALRNSANSRILIFTTSGSAGGPLGAQEWTNPTTFSSSLFSQNVGIFAGVPYWLRINSNGTTLTFYRSTNGVDWIQVGTRVISTFMGAIDQIGLGGVPQAAALCQVSNFGFTTPT